MAGRPQMNARTGPTYALASFMNDNWDTLVGRTNEDVSAALGYRTGNIISMFRTGKTRVPLEKLPEIASLMKLDLAVLLPLWFEQYWGERADAKKIIKEFGGRVMTANEAKLIDGIRDASRAEIPFVPETVKKVVAVLTDPDVAKAAETAAKKKGLL